MKDFLVNHYNAFVQVDKEKNKLKIYFTNNIFNLLFFSAPYSNWYNNSICTAPINYANFTCISSIDCDQTVGLVCDTPSSNCNCPTNSQNGMCDCPTGYYWDLVNLKCMTVLSCGNTCSASYQCSNTLTCTSSTCT